MAAEAPPIIPDILISVSEPIILPRPLTITLSTRKQPTALMFMNHVK